LRSLLLGQPVNLYDSCKARARGCSPSTIAREFERSTLPALPCGSRTARPACTGRRAAARPACKLDFDGVGRGAVRTLLRWKWSPRQIAATLGRVFPDEPERHVWHETIRTALCARARGALRGQLAACLRHGRSTRMPRSRGEDRRGKIPDMVGFHVRPPEAADRMMPGHCEGDFIKGSGNGSSAGVLVERTSRPVLLAKAGDATAASALAGISAKLHPIAAPLGKSFADDPGREMSRHAGLAAQTGVKVCSRDPHSPWQRGTCENNNGLMRQTLTKGTDLGVFSLAGLDGIADSLNTRTRATHNGCTPLEVLRRPWPDLTSLHLQFVEPGAARRA
jgi:IS30 family transposase